MWNTERLSGFKGSLYKKVIMMIEHYIEQGILVADERLPSERELATKLQVNRSTVVHALDELTQLGVLIRKRGSGTYVNAKKWGLQSSPTINWHLPINFKSKASLYQQKVQQLKQQQQPICDLSNGDLPIDMIPSLSLPNMSPQELIYHEKNSDSLQLGLPALREQIVAYMYEQFNLPVSIDDVLITSGTQQSLFLITQGLLKPGDAIGIDAPSYFYSLALFQAAGLRMHAINVDQQGICLEDLKAVNKQHHLKWIFLNPVFQNPTGLTMSSERRQQVLAFCRKQCIGIVEDDAYSALYFDKHIDNSPVKKLDKENQVIYLGSLSKYIGRSIRVGWMIAPSAIIHKLAEIRQHIDSGLSILPQLLAQDYLLHHYPSHQQQLREQLKTKADLLMQWLDSNYKNEMSYHKPQGGFHLYAKLNVANSKQEDDFLNQWLAKRIIVAKGENFGDSTGMVRLSYGHLDPLLL